nr:acylphosphatase-2 isoform X1 [Microcebus murinus]
MCPLPLAVAAPRTPLRLLGRGLAAAMSTAGPLKSVDYEVFGRVQGVCFRMYTEGEAKKIGVVGWVKNTSSGTVTGQVQGPEEKVDSIFGGFDVQDPKHWQIQCLLPRWHLEHGFLLQRRLMLVPHVAEGTEGTDYTF